MKEIAENFSNHRFVETYEHLDENIQWDNVGGETFTGKAAVVAACDQAITYFDTIRSTLADMKTSVGQTTVTIETTTEYADKDSVSTVASCDVYTFDVGKVVNITSYNVELSRK